MRRSLELILAGAMIFPSFTVTAALADDDADLPSPYQVQVNGVSVTVYQAHTWEPGYVPSYGGPYWFCSFNISEPAKVEVTTARSLDKLVVLPESRGVVAKVTGTNAVMQFSRPGQFVFEPDGKNGPLMIFANPPEQAPPAKDDPNVKYFGPGVHTAGAIELTDNQTLYLAAGALVRGGVTARGKNITIRGRGILDGNSYARFKGPTRYPVLLEDCRNVTVEGITIRTAGVGLSCRAAAMACEWRTSSCSAAGWRMATASTSSTRET
jgi:hypothetical protein